MDRPSRGRNVCRFSWRARRRPFVFHVCVRAKDGEVERSRGTPAAQWWCHHQRCDKDGVVEEGCGVGVSESLETMMLMTRAFKHITVPECVKEGVLPVTLSWQTSLFWPAPESRYNSKKTHSLNLQPTPRISILQATAMARTAEKARARRPWSVDALCGVLSTARVNKKKKNIDDFVPCCTCSWYTETSHFKHTKIVTRV